LGYVSECDGSRTRVLRLLKPGCSAVELRNHESILSPRDSIVKIGAGIWTRTKHLSAPHGDERFLDLSYPA